MGIFRIARIFTYYPMLIAITGAVLNLVLDFACVWRRRVYFSPMLLGRRCFGHDLIAQRYNGLMALYF